MPANFGCFADSVRPYSPPLLQPPDLSCQKGCDDESVVRCGLPVYHDQVLAGIDLPKSQQFARCALYDCRRRFDGFDHIENLASQFRMFFRDVEPLFIGKPDRYPVDGSGHRHGAGLVLPRLRYAHWSAHRRIRASCRQQIHRRCGISANAGALEPLREKVASNVELSGPFVLVADRDLFAWSNGVGRGKKAA